MLIAVVVLNMLLALFCFYVAWQVWQVRRALSQAADALLMAEQNTHSVLSGAPQAILEGQTGAQQLRQQYQQLKPKYQQVRQALTLLTLGSTVLRGRFAKRLVGQPRRSVSKSARQVEANRK